jgi:hypothetical protein
MEPSYVHLQQRFLLPVIVALFFVLLLALIAADDTVPRSVVAMAAVFMVFILAVAAHFSRMKVTVTSDTISAAFGSGWPRRTIYRSAIVSHTPVRNRWWYGWGLRWIPGGMLWNVWGLDAVELVLDDGRRFRIGTDDPEGLDAALG